MINSSIQHKITYRFLACLLVLFFCLSMTACTSKKDKQNAYKQKGVAYLSNAEYDKAVECFDKALSLSGGKVTEDEIDICYYKAAAQFNDDDFTGAIDTYTALKNYDQDNYEALFLRACLYLSEDEKEKAMKDYKEAIKRHPKDYNLYVAIYNNLIEEGYKQEATEIINTAIDTYSNNKQGLVDKGRIYYMLEQYDLAVENLERADKKGSNEANIYLAEVYYAKGNQEKGDKLIEEYKNKKHLSAIAYNALGELELSRSNYKEALKYFEKGLDLGSSDVEKDLLKNQIAANEYLGKYDEALKLAKSYVKTYPTDTDVTREIKFLKTR